MVAGAASSEAAVPAGQKWPSLQSESEVLFEAPSENTVDIMVQSCPNSMSRGCEKSQTK